MKNVGQCGFSQSLMKDLIPFSSETHCSVAGLLQRGTRPLFQSILSHGKRSITRFAN